MKKGGRQQNWWLRVIKGPEVDIVEKIKKARSKDEEIVRIVEEMKKAKVKELRAEIVWLHHDVLVAEHGGR